MYEMETKAIAKLTNTRAEVSLHFARYNCRILFDHIQMITSAVRQ